MVLDLVLKEISSDKPYKRTNDLIRAGRHVIPDSSSFLTLIKNGKPVFIPDNHWVANISDYQQLLCFIV